MNPVGEQLLAQVRETLNAEPQRLASDGLVRLTTLDSLTKQVGGYGDSPTGIHALSFAAKAAIAIFAIALLAGVATFALYIYLERKKYQQERRPRRRTSHHPNKELQKSGSNRTLGCEEASQASGVSETVGLGAGTAVVLEDGRPVVIEFGKEFQRKKRDAIEETRSVCGTIISESYGKSPKHVPKNNRRRRDAEESKLEDPPSDKYAFHPRSLSGEPVDPMSQSLYSEYTEQTATSDQIRNREFT